MKNKGGRPAYQPSEKDRAFVRSMAMAGVQHDRICKVIGVDAKTLRKHFREDLDFGIDKANATVIANLYRQATKDDPRAIGAAIYWTKARMGWSEKSQVELTGKDGGPIEHHVSGARDTLDSKLASLASRIGEAGVSKDAD